MQIKIKPLFDNVSTPEYATALSAGFDLKAHNFKEIRGYGGIVTNPNRKAAHTEALADGSGKYVVPEAADIPQEYWDKEVDSPYFHWEEQATETVLDPGQRILIGLGFAVELPEGYEMQIRPRSGLALKEGITVLNAPGTIDADYRKEVGVILINHSKDRVRLRAGDRIAQAVISAFEHARFDIVSELSETERTGGFGSTGK